MSEDGNASHMGATHAFTDHQLVNVIDGSASATYTLTAANGDTLVLAMVFQATNIPGGVTFAGDYTVTGGTGRFTGATGSGKLAGTALFTSETDGDRLILRYGNDFPVRVCQARARCTGIGRSTALRC